ncbi:hypothetical protein Tco_0596070 [Tanacetum coccineum]
MLRRERSNHRDMTTRAMALEEKAPYSMRLYGSSIDGVLPQHRKQDTDRAESSSVEDDILFPPLGSHIFPSRARGGLKSGKEKSTSGLETPGMVHIAEFQERGRLPQPT